jgi:hypothetical protein
MLSMAPASAMEDTQANRLTQAQRYAALYDFRAMIAELASASASANERQRAVQSVAKLPG